jgi:hypothetical protein
LIADAGSLELAHARIGARWGARTSEALWQRLELTRELAPMLELARDGGLAHWLHDLTAQADLPRIESALRQRWQEQVDEVAGWMPAAWQPSIGWCARLPALPAAQQWARGETLPAGVAQELGLETGDKAAPRGPTWRLLLDGARAEPSRILELWLAQWQRLLPQEPARAAIDERLVPLLQRHARAFAGAADGWAQRRALGQALATLRRRHLLEPLEVFAYLALQALELERVRAEIVSRRAFPTRAAHT